MCTRIWIVFLALFTALVLSPAVQSCYQGKFISTMSSAEKADMEEERARIRAEREARNYPRLVRKNPKLLVGKHMDDAIMLLGPPDRAVRLSNGGYTYAYEPKPGAPGEVVVQQPSGLISAMIQSAQARNRAKDYTCRRFISTDAEHIIVAVNQEGC